MLADRNPGWCRITSWVAVCNSAASSAARSGSTVNTLIKVAYPLFCSMVVIFNLHVRFLTQRYHSCKVPAMETSGTEHAVGYLVKRVQQSLRRRRDAALRRPGLSRAHFPVLRAVADHPEASASELSRLCFVTRQSLQDVLSGLRSSGLVSESDRGSRGRARALMLTVSGAKRLAAAHAAVMGVEATMTHGIPPKVRRELVAALTRCPENLETA